ncbi:hypothetical protein [Novipirellula artificiosorum]|uniref:Gfo/Idh/MocA-like oxidoreductase N-terminal domain-containing protein n=1 Tax=Novipirellula artificiosorum TaxID=2528016 RepID=A0A5C6DSQ9_9BACT|nr:hypothetical protein [Novipirellula artificiosorum]TWU39682.1 hypothetical protein Poly41_25380 [Novipirellula artificiosorum]
MSTQRPSKSRRDFVKSSVGAAAASTIVPRVMSAAEGKPPASERLRLAFIGVGGRGRHNLTSLAGLGCEVVALCDVDSIRPAPCNGSKQWVEATA